MIKNQKKMQRRDFDRTYLIYQADFVRALDWQNKVEEEAFIVLDDITIYSFPEDEYLTETVSAIAV